MEANYWYHGQIRKIILHTLRIFSNFYISVGKDENGKDKLRRVPVNFMSTDKSALFQMNNATDAVIESCPKMVLTISEIRPNSDRGYAAPYEPYESEFTEKKWNEETGNYEYDVGNTYSVKRLNPVPIGITFKLYILTTLQTQKFQLFEQIRTLFSPTLELQTSENPLDWTRVTAITLTGINYSSKGTSNLDGTQLDAMDMTFEVNTNLDVPALIDKSNVIETIITNIADAESGSDIYGWEFDDVVRTYYTPHQSSIVVKDNKEVILKPGNYANWYKLFKAYAMPYDATKNNTYLHLKLEDREIVGIAHIDIHDNMKLIWNPDMASLPEPNLDPLTAVIDPHNFTPENVKGERYMIVDELGSGSVKWGQLKDINNNDIQKIDSHCIIEYNGENWVLKTDPSQNPAVYYIKNNDDDSLLTWNDEYQEWVDVINGTYQEGYWRLSQI